MAGGISGSKISCLLAGYMLAGSMLAGCRSGSATADAAGDADSLPADIPAAVEAFSADSAFSYVKRQTDFGPRVPNTDAHRRAGDWIAATLRRHLRPMPSRGQGATTAARALGLPPLGR